MEYFALNVGRNKKAGEKREAVVFHSLNIIRYLECVKKKIGIFFTAEPIFRVCKEENWDFILNVSFRYSWMERKKKAFVFHWILYLLCKEENQDFILNVSFRYIFKNGRKKKSSFSMLNIIPYLEYTKKKNFISYVSFRAIEERKRKKEEWSDEKVDRKRKAVVLHSLNRYSMINKEENRDFMQNVSFRANDSMKKKRGSTRSSLLNIRYLCKEENRDFI